MTDIPYTPEEGALIDTLISWARDQDHDAASMGDPDYLWFLTEDDQTTDQVRELLDSAYGKASRGVTVEDVLEVEQDDEPITPEARAAVERLLNREVYVVITPDEDRPLDEWDVEVLDEAPRWNAAGQIVRVANVNGGDSAIVHPRPGTADRADVTRRMAQAFGISVENRELGSEKAMLDVFGIIRGIVNEYHDDGDQMMEATCICQVSPGGYRILNPVCPNHGVIER